MHGTKWLVEDRCDSTLTDVREGHVAVRDLVKRKTVIVRAGKKYVAKRSKCCGAAAVDRRVESPGRSVPSVNWVNVLAVFIVAHMVGDYLFQTDWQARHKRGGLSGGVALRALATHVATYTLAFVPALIWIADGLDAGWAVLAGVLVALPHLVVDDGRIVRAYLSHVKRAPGFDISLAASVDQSFHILSLCLVALLVGAA